MGRRKSILITGAGSGIGKATARLFASNGWLVGVADVNGLSAEATASELGANGVAITADVRTRDGAQAMVDAFTKHTGGMLDVLFNCAGVLFMGPHETIDPARQDLMIDVNIKGVVNCVDAAFEALKATPGAHVVSMCSTASEYGAPDHAIYSGTKFFVRGFTEALNIEWARHDINVSAIVVAYVQTPMVLKADVKAKSVDRLGVKVKPDAVAAGVWKAAHTTGSIHRLGVDATALNLAVRLLGKRSRGVFRILTGY